MAGVARLNETLAVLFRDPRFVVIDKPAGLPVHPSRGDTGDSVEGRFASLGRFREGPWLAHRLDRDTAGCLLIALRRSALRSAQACFVAGTVEKTYWAIVDGVPAEREGEIVSMLGRVEKAGAWRMMPTPDGARAVTRWRLLGTDGRVSGLELEPLTGRTHQVRAHCAALGCPVLGDAVYGKPDPGGLRLLARRLRVPVEPTVSAVAGGAGAFGGVSGRARDRAPGRDGCAWLRNPLSLTGRPGRRPGPAGAKPQTPSYGWVLRATALSGVQG